MPVAICRQKNTGRSVSLNILKKPRNIRNSSCIYRAGNDTDINPGDANVDRNNNGDGTVSGELGNSVRDLGEGVGNAVEDVGDAVGNAAEGR